MNSLLQIAPTIAEYFNVRLSSPAHPVEQILKFVRARYPIPSVVLLLVVDSLDIPLYSDFADDLRGVHGLVEHEGLLLECETVSNHTTPAIGSILTGLEPEAHGIFTDNDVGKSKIKSILEILEDTGKKTAMVIETGGAKPLIDRISYVFAVDDREDILEYDELIKAHTIAVLQKRDVRLVFSHLRAIDRFAHRDQDLRVAAKVTDGNIKELANAVRERDGLLLICGDHEAHIKAGKRTGTVPLIVSCP